jgi:uncharacterized protein with HEPN domain
MRSETSTRTRAADERRFIADRMRQDATLRKLQIIGEAVKRLSEDSKSKQPQIPSWA